MIIVLVPHQFLCSSSTTGSSMKSVAGLDVYPTPVPHKSLKWKLEGISNWNALSKLVFMWKVAEEESEALSSEEFLLLMDILNLYAVSYSKCVPIPRNTSCAFY